MLNLPPRRFRSAWAFTWAASIVSVALAIGPDFRGRYNSSLAVLTATLIAVIWYTYFTYRSIHRAEATLVAAEMRGLVHPLLLELSLELTNHSGRRVVVRPHLELWVDAEQKPFDAFYTAGDNLVLEPHQSFWRDLRFPLTPPESDLTTSPHDWEVRARMVVFWADDLSETGRLGPYSYYAVLLTGPSLGPTLGEAQLKKLFGHLPAGPTSPPCGWSPLLAAVTAA